jgi:pantothenate kinase
VAITYEPVTTTTLSSAASTITFSSIPATWTDLRLVFVVSSTSTATNFQVQLNSDTATNYSSTYLNGNGTAASSGRNTSATNIQFTDVTATSTTVPQMYTMDIFSYAGATFKTVLGTSSQDYNGSGSTASIVGLYRSTSAITSITLKTSGVPTFSTGTTATLYGIKKA